MTFCTIIKEFIVSFIKFNFTNDKSELVLNKPSKRWDRKMDVIIEWLYAKHEPNANTTNHGAYTYVK